MCNGELESDSGADWAVTCPEHGERAIRHVCSEWLKELEAELAVTIKERDAAELKWSNMLKNRERWMERLAAAREQDLETMMDIQGED